MTIHSRIPARNHYCISEWHFKNVIWNFWEEILRNTTIATINLKCLGSHYHSVFDFQKSKKARFICEVIKLCILGCKDSTKFQFFSRFCVSLGTEFKLFVKKSVSALFRKEHYLKNKIRHCELCTRSVWKFQNNRCSNLDVD